MAERIPIRSNKRGHALRIVSPKDFELDEEGTEIGAEEVARDPRFSLYCFDRENDSALFVECDDPAAVDRAPFYYAGQIEHAAAVVRMHLAEFHRTAEEIPEPSGGLIWVHSTGRCGSTLVSKAFEAIPEVYSLSEPDDLTQMIGFRTADGAVDDWLRAALRSSVRWRNKPRAGPPVKHLAIKTRSEVIALADLIGEVFPDAKHIFLYRDGVSWMQSVYKNWSPDRDVYDEEKNDQMKKGWSDTLPYLAEEPWKSKKMNAIEIRILAWVMCMEGFFRLAESVPVCAARFEDLTASPIEVLAHLLAYGGIANADWDVIREVLGRDSQAGTIFDREERKKRSNELTPELVQDVRAMVATRPLLGSPEVILPGTITV